MYWPGMNSGLNNGRINRKWNFCFSLCAWIWIQVSYRIRYGKFWKYNTRYDWEIYKYYIYINLVWKFIKMYIQQISLVSSKNFRKLREKGRKKSKIIFFFEFDYISNSFLIYLINWYNNFKFVDFENKVIINVRR